MMFAIAAKEKFTFSIKHMKGTVDSIAGALFCLQKQHYRELALDAELVPHIPPGYPENMEHFQPDFQSTIPLV